MYTPLHRVNTLLYYSPQYDRLIVLDEGKIVEFDTPYNLIQKEGGCTYTFYSLLFPSLITYTSIP